MAEPIKNSQAKKRADRIRAQVPIIQVLAHYGYHIDPNGGDREQQFSCDMHGSGRDAMPSARAYPDSNSFYCFGCGRTRDPIQLVREKEGLDFWKAIKILEARFHLPKLPWEQDAPEEDDVLANTLRQSLTATRGGSFSDEQARMERLLTSVTGERELPMNTILAFWEVLDRVRHGVGHEAWEEAKGVQALATLRERVMARLVQEAENPSARGG